MLINQLHDVTSYGRMAACIMDVQYGYDEGVCYPNEWVQRNVAY